MNTSSPSDLTDADFADLLAMGHNLIRYQCALMEALQAELRGSPAVLPCAHNCLRLTEAMRRTLLLVRGLGEGFIEDGVFTLDASPWDAERDGSEADDDLPETINGLRPAELLAELCLEMSVDPAWFASHSCAALASVTQAMAGLAPRPTETDEETAGLWAMMLAHAHEAARTQAGVQTGAA